MSGVVYRPRSGGNRRWNWRRRPSSIPTAAELTAGVVAQERVDWPDYVVELSRLLRVTPLVRPLAAGSPIESTYRGGPLKWNNSPASRRERRRTHHSVVPAPAVEGGERNG